MSNEYEQYQEQLESHLLYMAEASQKAAVNAKNMAKQTQELSSNLGQTVEEIQRTDKLTRVDLKLKTKNLNKGLAGVIQNIGEFNNALANDIMYGLDLSGNSFTGYLKNNKVEEIATNWSNQTLDLSEQFKESLGDSFNKVKRTTFKNADLMSEIARLQEEKTNATSDEKKVIEEQIKVLQGAKTQQEEALKLSLAEVANSTDKFTNFSNGFKKLTFGAVDIGGSLDAGMEWVNAIKDVGAGFAAGASVVKNKLGNLFGFDMGPDIKPKTPEEETKEDITLLGKASKHLTLSFEKMREHMWGVAEAHEEEREAKEENLDLLDKENKKRQKSIFGLGGLAAGLLFLVAMFTAWKNDNWGAIASGLKYAIEKATEKLAQWGDDLAKMATAAGEKLTGALSSLSGKITGSKLYTKIFGSADDAAKPGLLGKVTNAVKNTASKGLDLVKNSAVGKTVSNVVSGAKQIGGAIAEKSSKVMSYIGKGSKLLLRGLPIIGAVIEGTVDWMKVDADYKKAKTLYEMGQLMVPEDPENPDSDTRPMNETEWADFEKAVKAAKAGSFGRAIGSIAGQSAAAAMSLFSGGLAGAAVGVTMSMGGAHYGDKLATAMYGGDEAYQAVQARLRGGGSAINTPVEEIQAGREELAASAQSQTNNNINNVVSEVNTSNFNSGGQYHFKDGATVNI